MIGNGRVRPRPRAASGGRSMLTRDEELGKRDDDFRPKTPSPSWNGLFSPLRWRKRRVVLVIAVVAFVYLFVHNIPTDLGPIDKRLGMPPKPGHIERDPAQIRKEKGTALEPSGPPPRAPNGEDEGLGIHYYNGPITFYRLASSLHRLSSTMGHLPNNRNVLFAASSLRSASNLIPMACDMAKRNRNIVHLAIMGRDPLPLADILDVNGLGSDTCGVTFHDARGDYMEYSSDMRAESCVAGAMKHINDFMHPQAVIMDDSLLENKFFTSGIRRKTAEYKRPLIEIPDGAYESFGWMTRLTADSLADWFTPTLDILIHVPPNSAGGLIRLVKSLLRANYDGLRVPRITVELPQNIEPFARRWLESIVWPPTKDQSPLNTKQLSLRHRISSSRVTPEQASIRFLESFYPSDPFNNHVLILSPQVEIDPMYLHYLHYMMLEYAYSSELDDQLLGISLDVPSTFINGSGSFDPPTMGSVHGFEENGLEKIDDTDKTSQAPFLYQAPSAAAALIFADKWTAFHDFLSNRLESSHSGRAQKMHKQVSETEPSWLEYLLELMRARGWEQLHPAQSFATVHNELAQIPEEYLRRNEEQDEDDGSVEAEELRDEPFLTGPDPPSLQTHAEDNPFKGTDTPLHSMLPLNGKLPELSDLPHVLHTGDMVSRVKMTELRKRYLSLFRQHIGGCDDDMAKRPRLVENPSTADLFCFPGQEVFFADDDEGGQTIPEEPAKDSTRSPSKDDTASAAGGADDGAKESSDSREPESARSDAEEDDDPREDAGPES